MENAELRNQVADLKEGGVVELGAGNVTAAATVASAAAVADGKEDKGTLLPPPPPQQHQQIHNCADNPPNKCGKEQQRTPATSCDFSYSGDEELCNGEETTTIVHLLASHCSVVSSSSSAVHHHGAFPSSDTSIQRSTTSFGKLSRKLPKLHRRRSEPSRRRGGGHHSLAWMYSSPFLIPRRIVTTKEEEHGHDALSELSSCM
jgi:hypothetical protein